MAEINVTWVKSAIGYNKDQKLTLKALGFRKMNQTVVHQDTQSIRGMINKVRHLVRVEEKTE